MSDTRLAWLQIHFCVVLWGFTAILGKLISLSALTLVIWRMGLVALALLVLPAIWQNLRRMPRQDALAFCGIGVLVALHWLTFYGAIKLSNASVAVTCIATVPVFLSFTEPVLVGRRFQLSELALAIMVLPGIVLVVGGTPENMNVGIMMGITSAFFVALFAALNKRWIFRGDPLTVTAIEMASGSLLLLTLSAISVLFSVPALPGLTTDDGVILPWPDSRDWLWMLLLAGGCTLLPFALSLLALRQLSAYASALAVNLEPVYAILLAALLLNEQEELTLRFYAGAVLIVFVVLLYPWLSTSKKYQRQ